MATRLYATGRSDYPNQINNVLCFPGLYKGLLDSGVKRVTREMLMRSLERRRLCHQYTSRPGHFLAKGGDPKLMMAEIMGRDSGYCRGKGGSMHIADISHGIIGANGIVGAGIPIADVAASLNPTQTSHRPRRLQARQ